MYAIYILILNVKACGYELSSQQKKTLKVQQKQKKEELNATKTGSEESSRLSMSEEIESLSVKDIPGLIIESVSDSKRWL
jgi:hypothetical protein